MHRMHRIFFWRQAGGVHAGNRELSKGSWSAFREVAGRIFAPPHHREDTTRERGRPARMHSRSVPLSFPAMWHPATQPAGTPWAGPKQSPGAVAGRARWRSWPRLCQDVCGRDARAPGWASSPDAVAANEVHRYLCLFAVRPQQPSAVSSSNDLPGRAGGV